MAIATRLACWRNPVAHSAQADRAGRHSDLRIPGRGFVNSTNHAAQEYQRIDSEFFRESQLASMRENLHPGRRDSESQSSGRLNEHGGELQPFCPFSEAASQIARYEFFCLVEK